MAWYYIVAIISAVICFVVFLGQAAYLLVLGAPEDLSEKSGSVAKGVLYSYTVAMSPSKKESAYKHLPTYISGIIFHIGVFITLLFCILMLIPPISAIFGGSTGLYLPKTVNIVLIVTLALSSVCGVAILVKRFVKKELQYFSSPDDYISNILTTAAQVVTLAYILFGSSVGTAYYVTLSLLLLWMPFGKTKHVLYFFFARFHLGYFYGRRGSWPVKTDE